MSLSVFEVLRFRPKTPFPLFTHVRFRMNSCGFGLHGLHFCTGRPKGFALISGVVANTSRNTGLNNPAKADTLRFEEALKKLEAIVDAMESEELPLETLLAKYEEGNRLAKVCQDKLAEAELKIQQLEKTTAGELKLKPLPMNEQTE